LYTPRPWIILQEMIILSIPDTPCAATIYEAWSERCNLQHRPPFYPHLRHRRISASKALSRVYLNFAERLFILQVPHNPTFDSIKHGASILDHRLHLRRDQRHARRIRRPRSQETHRRPVEAGELGHCSPIPGIPLSPPTLLFLSLLSPIPPQTSQISHLCYSSQLRLYLEPYLKLKLTLPSLANAFRRLNLRLGRRAPEHPRHGPIHRGNDNV